MRLAVIGVGRIGGEVAYLAAVLGLADELVLWDTAADLLKAQALDLRHTGLGIPVDTDTRLIRDADICVFSAGLPRNPSVRTRADLVSVNLPVVEDTTGLIAGFSGVLVTVTNPMDVNNFYLCKRLGIDRGRCIGFGGQLDGARFALALEERGIRIGTGNGSHACVLGEHGEHQVPVFSRVAPAVGPDRRDEILAALRGASMEVIKGKGGTVFGPAWHIATLIRRIATDSRELTACSAVLGGEYGISGCSLGVPARVGREGIRTIEEWKLDDWEAGKMEEAGAFMAELCRKAVG
ncbi:MAG TPA: lactate dehydrogenase [Methanoregula sp.]|nr:lactate dehydrogenase [Methanoregula sp.]